MSKLDEILRRLLRKTFSNDKYKPEMNIQQLSSGGANFSSEIFRARVESVGDGKDLHLFAKVAGWPEASRLQINCDFAYEGEQHFYTTIAPTYEAIQDKYAIEQNDRYVTPKYYAHNPSFLEETLVLEDLGAHGYSCYNRFEPLDWEYTSKAVEQLAKLHALSFVHKKEYPEMHAHNVIVFDWTNSFFMQFLEVFRKTTKSVCEVIPEDMRERLHNFVEFQLTDEMKKKYYGPGKWGVFTHGDYRASNIMYKRSKNGKVNSLIPIDYQTLHFGSPSVDLHYLIYTGTDEEFRRQHLPNLLDHYYNTLSRWLTIMDINPETTFSRKDFDEDYKDMLPIGLVMATGALPIVLVEEEDAPKMDAERNDLNELSVKISDKFVKRYLPILKYFSDLGVL